MPNRAGTLLAAGVCAYVMAFASIIGWRLVAPDSLPPLWLHIPLVVAAGGWAWWRWENRPDA